MHVAVPDGRQRFDAEEKASPVAVRIEVRNACGVGRVGGRERQIEQKEKEAIAREQTRPADRHEVMVEVLPGTVRQAEPGESAPREEPGDHRPGRAGASSAMSAFAAAMIESGAKPKRRSSSLRGAEAPKVCIPMIRPRDPTWRSQPNVEACSIAIRASTAGGRTWSR